MCVNTFNVSQSDGPARAVEQPDNALFLEPSNCDEERSRCNFKSLQIEVAHVRVWDFFLQNFMIQIVNSFEGIQKG